VLSGVHHKCIVLQVDAAMILQPQQRGVQQAAQPQDVYTTVLQPWQHPMLLPEVCHGLLVMWLQGQGVHWPGIPGRRGASWHNQQYGSSSRACRGGAVACSGG
jgi:hypothetical protein